VKLPANATAAIRQSSLLGEKYVELASPAGDKPEGRLRDGSLKSGTPPFERCTDSRLPDSLPHMKAVIARLNADPARLLTQVSLEKEHYTDAREVINPQRRYGDMPLIVMTAGRDEDAVLSALSHLPPGTP